MGIRKKDWREKSRNYQEGHDGNTRVTTSGTVCPLVRRKSQTDRNGETILMRILVLSASYSGRRAHQK